MPEDAIWKSRVRQVMPANVMKSFGAEGRSHGIHFDYDKSQLCQRREALGAAERFRHVSALRPRIDTFQNGIFFARDQDFWAGR